MHRGPISRLVLIVVMVISPLRLFAQHSARLVHGRDTVVFVCSNDRTFEMSYRLGHNIDTASLIFDPSYHPQGSFNSVDSDASGLHIKGGMFRIEVTASPLSVTVFDSINRNVFSTLPDTGFVANACYANVIHGDYYGLDNRIWGIARGDWPSWVFTGDYGNASGMMVWSTEGFGVVADVDDGSANVVGYSGQLHYTKEKSRRKNNVLYMTFGTPKRIFNTYADILGHAHMPPLWSVGFMHSKWGQNQEEDYKLAAIYRAKGIPVDAFAFDYEWMDWGGPWGEFKWNSHNFPDAESGRFADSMKTLGITLMGIRKPRIHYNLPEGIYAAEHGYLLPDAPFTDYVSGQQVALLNFYDSAVRAWYWNALIEPDRDPFARGLKALWNDEVGYQRSLYCPYMQKAQYDGQRSYNNDRVFSLNRNYFIGSNRFAYGMWSGDIGSDYHSIAAQRTEVMTSALLGDGWWSMDIGGFWGQPDSSVGTSELFIRWMELGAFVPFYRIHACIGREREFWYYGQHAEAVSTEYVKLRYRLIPYTYGLFRTFADEGLPPVRPFVFDFPTDVISHFEGKAYMFGPSMIVSPVVDSGMRTSTFHLPPGSWVNFWTDSILWGGSDATIEAALETIPVLIKRGAIIPQRVPGTFSLDTNSFKDIRFHVYSGASDAMTYYEDDFNSYDYEKGVFAKIPYSHQYLRDAERIVIGPQTGNYHVPSRRGYFVVHCIDRTVTKVLYNNSELALSGFDSIHSIAGQGWAFDSVRHELVVAITDPFAPGEIELDPVVDYSKQADSLDGPLVEVVPNPSVGAIRWRIDSPIEQTIETTITSVLGNQVLHRSDELRRGLNLLGYNGSYLAAGAYDITVQGAGWKRTVKAVVLSR